MSGPTHRRGHILDLIITRKDESLIKEVQVLNDIYPDHRVVTCKLDFPRPPRSRILVTCRPYKNFDSDKLRQDISETLSRLTQDHNISAENYKTLSDVYDDHFPLRTLWVTHRSRTAWYNQDLKAAKHEKRQAERKYRKTGLAV